MQSITLLSRPQDGPFSVLVRPGQKAAPGQRHVEVILRAGSKEPFAITARFKEVPSREHLIALQARDDGAMARDLAALGLIEPETLKTRLDGAPALICIAKGELLAEVLKAKSFEPRPEQGATIKPVEDAPAAPAKPKRRARESGE